MLHRMLALGEQLRLPLLEFLKQWNLLALVQGALLELDPYWWAWFRQKSFKGCSSDSAAALIPPMWPPASEMAYSLPDDWKSHARRLGLRDDSPFILRLTLWHDVTLPPHPPGEFNQYPLRWERRPDAVAASFSDAVSPLLETGKVRRWFGPKGFSVGGDPPHASGTAGGVIRSGRDIHVVSCAHVLGPVGTPVYTPGPHEGKERLS